MRVTKEYKELKELLIECDEMKTNIKTYIKVFNNKLNQVIMYITKKIFKTSL